MQPYRTTKPEGAESFFSPEQRRALLFCALLFIVGLLLIGFHDTFVNSSWTFLPRKAADGLLGFAFLSVLDNLGDALIVAALLSLFVEISLRARHTREVIAAVRSASAPTGIRQVILHRFELDDRASADIRSLRAGDRLDLIGTSQRVVFSDRPGYDKMAERVKDGVHMRIILLHPDSHLVPCIEGISALFGFPNLRLSLSETALGRIAKMRDMLHQSGARGSVEVRLHKDLYSTLSYHSSPNMTSVGFYFAHESGTQCPCLILDDGELRREAGLHFERLWELSRNNVLLRIDRAGVEDRLAEVFGSVDGPARGEAEAPAHA